MSDQQSKDLNIKESHCRKNCLFCRTHFIRRFKRDFDPPMIDQQHEDLNKVKSLEKLVCNCSTIQSSPASVENLTQP